MGAGEQGKCAAISLGDGTLVANQDAAHLKKLPQLGSGGPEDIFVAVVQVETVTDELKVRHITLYL